MILFSAFSLLIIFPTASFAWRDGANGYWYYHGSGRDYSYSYVIDQSSPGYADYTLIEAPDYVDAAPYLNGTPMPITQVNEFTVNVPNDHGGYTPVLIKRSGNGYIGPQGEFYPEFPKVSQLKIMYGK